MATRVDERQSEATVEDLIALFGEATHAREVEMIADFLGEAGDARAIQPLLMRLGDCQVQDDGDVEQAVCGALMALGVMCTSGEHSFRLRPRSVLTDDVVATIRELSGAIPWQYFGKRCLEPCPTSCSAARWVDRSPPRLSHR